MKTYGEIVAYNIKRLLREHDMTQNELAKKIGVTPMAVTNWCNNVNTPRNDKIDKICEILRVSRNEITEEQSAIPNLSVPAAYPVPIIGVICAGDGILAEQNYKGYFFVDHTIRADYCLEVEGDSMKDAHIYHGDIAFLRKNFDFLNGAIYAVVFGEDERASLKKVYKQGNNLLLMPCNQDYAPITVDGNSVLICGELIGVYSPRNNR